MRVILESLRHRYNDLPVLDNLSLTVGDGEIVALVGPSGCGKSTLLSIIGGMLVPSGGRVSVAGAAASDCLNPITFVFQDFALLPWRTVAGNVSLVLEDTSLAGADRRARIAEVLSLTGLSDFADAYPKQLSGGMRQRAGIARALAVKPAVMLMDEPLSALDAQTRLLLINDFRRLFAAGGMTVVYVTHNLAEAALVAHRIVVLSRRPASIRRIVPVDVPIAERAPSHPRLQAIEAGLWDLIRDEAVAADREIGDAA